MEKYYWDNKIEYLEETRKTWFNYDYIEFLIQSVWKINKPESIADFGCGNGFLASVLMPRLPKGSTYTGYDKGEGLIENAQKLFSKAPFDVEFIHCDLIKEEITKKYDLVICQAFLMHIPEPEHMLRKMIDAVKSNGLVICIETNWNVANAAMYIDGLDVDGQCNLGILQKLWMNEKEELKTDKCIGMKIPCIMQEQGLKDISIRMNDCVRFANPYGDSDDYIEVRNTLLADGWGHDMDDRGNYIKNLCSRGVTLKEAELQYNCEKEINEFVKTNKDNIMMLTIPPMFISYGRK